MVDENMIFVEKLVKKFKEVQAVKGISFSVKKGEIFAFLGPNGAGKTTSIKMFTTLLHPTSGRILVDGADPVHQQDKVRHSFGIVFQDQSVDDELTAYENMEFHGVFYNVPKKLRKERIEHLLKFVGLWDRKDSMVRTFSGGMKRRLEIARALIHHPKILFLDEPTLGLDPQTRNHMWEYIKKLNKEEGMTVFFTTHYMEEADRISDRIAIIDHGKIIKIDSPKNIKKSMNAKTLEIAFLKLTGDTIREQEASAAEGFRSHARAWGRR